MQRTLCLTGRELCRYSGYARDEVSCLGWDSASVNYKEFQLAGTLAVEGLISLDEAPGKPSKSNQSFRPNY